MATTSEYNPERKQLDDRIAGWQWLVREFERVAAQARAEALRLLGPDRGE